MTTEQRDDGTRAAIARACTATLREAQVLIGTRCRNDPRSERLVRALDRLVLLLAKVREEARE